jgi:hypothetical protein
VQRRREAPRLARKVALWQRRHKFHTPEFTTPWRAGALRAGIEAPVVLGFVVQVRFGLAGPVALCECPRGGPALRHALRRVLRARWGSRDGGPNGRLPPWF